MTHPTLIRIKGLCDALDNGPEMSHQDEGTLSGVALVLARMVYDKEKHTNAMLERLNQREREEKDNRIYERVLKCYGAKRADTMSSCPPNCPDRKVCEEMRGDIADAEAAEAAKKAKGGCR